MWKPYVLLGIFHSFITKRPIPSSSGTPPLILRFPSLPSSTPLSSSTLFARFFAHLHTRHVVRPARALCPKSRIFGTLVIGSDRLPFWTQFPTTSHQQQPQPIDRSLLPSRPHSAHAHRHTLSPSSFVSHYFTHTPSSPRKWTAPTALRAPVRGRASPRLVYLASHIMCRSPRPCSLFVPVCTLSPIGTQLGSPAHSCFGNSYLTIPFHVMPRSHSAFAPRLVRVRSYTLAQLLEDFPVLKPPVSC